MTDTLPFLDLKAPGFSTRSPQVIAARRKGWAARTPFGLAVLRHRECGQLLRDRRLRQGSHGWPDLVGLRGSFANFWKRSIISQEGAAHRELRALAAPALHPDFIDSLRPEFEAAAEALTDRLRSGTRTEFMSGFSIPYAGQAISILLGMGRENGHLIGQDASDLGLAMGVDAKAYEGRVNAALDRLMGLADTLIDKAEAGADQTSYVARLVAAEKEQGQIGRTALRDLVVISIFGGVDTTRAQLAFLMALFAAHPDQWQALRADGALVPNAVEEAIRLWPTTTWVTREAVEDFTFEGVDIGRGEILHMFVHATSTDPAIRSNPDFDIKAPQKSHFGFGAGAHHCMGQLVARTDMAVALDALRKTFLRFKLDGAPDYLPDSGNTGPVRLPLVYELG